eukprot:Gregarina_sp_Poly_1__5608@NODE_295_length_9857_cov_104_674974_g255_i0_p4_GENE_NODE_295_length_9857_cov_104_674974_g255_i0NODE_295_length_9857_cov_104_674974_g255_i0_p4_ORF_typecomplete_len231_score36_46_NODE_295_length_9857_cov_104_674974_g255_i070787770
MLEMRQRKYETPWEFGRRLEVSLETIREEGPGRDLVNEFIRGLRVPRCREFVFYRRPPNLEAAIEAANQFSQVHSAINETTPTQPPFLSEASTAAETDPESLPQQATHIEHLQAHQSLGLRLYNAGADEDTVNEIESLIADLDAHDVRNFDEPGMERHMQEYKRRWIEQTMKYNPLTRIDIDYRGFRVFKLFKIRPCRPILSITVRNPSFLDKIFRRIQAWNENAAFPAS